MTHAYDESLINRAAGSLGRMLDFAVHSLRQDADSMMDLFCASGLAALFEHGDIHVIAGMSGIELAYETLERSGLTCERVPQRHTKSLSSEYWCGYALARMQWETCLDFSAILARFTVQDMIAEHSKLKLRLLEDLPLAVSSDEKAAALAGLGKDYSDTMCLRLTGRNDSETAGPGRVKSVPGSALKKMRKKNGLSQSDLAAASGIPVRTIQQYEQGQKDIGKARAEYLIILSRVLGCDPASLI